ncbi:NAD(P)-binding domain-containing protein [Streptomyces anulatus]
MSGPAAAADGAEVICTVLPDSEEVRTVVGEVLTAAKPGAAVVEMTTHSPQVARELVERAGSLDVEYLDCPAGGGIAAVRTGALAFWAGGSERLRHCGTVGSGPVVKLLDNYLVAVNAAAPSEALALDARPVSTCVRRSRPSSRAAGGANAQLANPYPNRVPGRGLRARLQHGCMVKVLRHAFDFDLEAEPGVDSPLGRAAGARRD